MLTRGKEFAENRGERQGVMVIGVKWQHLCICAYNQAREYSKQHYLQDKNVGKQLPINRNEQVNCEVFK